MLLITMFSIHAGNHGRAALGSAVSNIQRSSDAFRVNLDRIALALETLALKSLYDDIADMESQSEEHETWITRVGTASGDAYGALVTRIENRIQW